VLTSQLPSSEHTTFAIQQKARPSRDPKLPIFTEERLHKIMGHANTEAIKHVLGAVQGINVDDSVPCPSSCNCSICALSKAKNIISRRPGSENRRNGKPFDCLCWDALIMDIAYNGDSYISHFYCPDSHFHLTFSCQSKRDFKDTLQTALKLIQHQWGFITRFLRLDGKTSLIPIRQQLAKEEGLILEISAPDTHEQNGAAERSGGVIITKARAIGLEASIPHSLWPETIKTAGYIANRTPVQQLGWKTPFEYVTGSKPSFAHLKVYGSKAYVLNKHIPKSLKLEPRAHIGYLIGYDSTNIFRIWILSRETVIRTRDITFDQDSFYSPKDLDLRAMFTESAENIIEILKLPDFDIERDEIEDIIYDIIIVNIPSEPAMLSPELSNSDSASLAN
jgi:hypothetical protein